MMVCVGTCFDGKINLPVTEQGSITEIWYQNEILVPIIRFWESMKNQNFILKDINAPDPLHQEHSLLNGPNWEAIHSKRRHRAAIIAANGGHTHYRDAINEFSANFSHFDFFSPLPKNVTFWGVGYISGLYTGIE